MKSLHLTNAYHPASGGIRTWYGQVLAAAAAEGWESRLVVPGEQSYIEHIDDHARIYHVRSPRAPVFDRRYRLILPHRYLLPGGAVRRILLQEQPDLVEVGDKYALNWLGGAVRKGLIPRLRRPSLVGYSFERMDDNLGAYLRMRGGLARRLARLYMRWCYYPMFDFHLAASGYTADELRQAAPDRADRVYVQPCAGLDVAQFGAERRSAGLRAQLLQAVSGNSDTALLLYVGRLSPEKNISLLVDLMTELASGSGDYRLIVAGSGPMLEWLRGQSAALDPGRIVLWGQVQDRQALASLYATCDVFVHPNPREPFGIAPLEAMASGCPVVLPDRGGVLTYADASNAWLAPPTAHAFADAVRRLIGAPGVRQDRASRARATALQFESRRMVHQLFDTYRQFCRGFERSTHGAATGPIRSGSTAGSPR